jgi:hypothetical protein
MFNVKFLNHQMMLKSNEKESHSPKVNVIVQYSFNKMINSGIMRMFIFFIIFIFIYSILLAKCYAFTKMFGMLLV